MNLIPATLHIGPAIGVASADLDRKRPSLDPHQRHHPYPDRDHRQGNRHEHASPGLVLVVSHSSSSQQLLSGAFRAASLILLHVSGRCMRNSFSLGPGAHPRNLGAAVVEAVEHVREKWSAETVEYDHARNNDNSSKNSNAYSW
jgi:hypothetical protein